MRSEWCSADDMGHVLAALMPTNRLVMEVALHTGLRVGDVVALRADKLAPRMTVRESKTGKSRRISLPAGLLSRLREQSGALWVFPGRIDQTRHRTRQAVWADVKRAARLFRLPANVTPHSTRKLYAVEQYRRTGSIDRVRRLLNHDSDSVTMLYAIADHLAAKRGASRAAARASRPRRERGR